MQKRILVIDDDPSVRLLLSDALPADQYELTLLDNGEDGLTKLREGGYDLVLLDVMLPKIDGIGVLTELQNAGPKSPNKKIILFTSLHDDPAVTEGMNKGAAGFLIKSDLAPDVLISKIKELVE